jgi:SSS family solute:Na+ symporter
MQPIDWILVTVPLVIVLTISVFTRRYLKSVAGFLSGGRLAGRYLLAVASGEMQAGAVTFVAAFEVISKAGFTMTWWSWINVPVWLLLGTTGFVVYRYRQTRAMTLAQFFEIRYSKRYRLFTGMLGFLSGLANFGIIPAVSARFFVIMLGLPQEVHVGALSLPTYVPLMAGFLCITMTVALSGGFLTIMLTNCVEGIISQILYLVIIASLLSMFSWTEISQTLSARPHGQSMLNPFDSFSAKDFNIWYVLMGMFGGIYGTMAWQYQSAYNSAPISPHEGRMAGVLGRWREMGKAAIVALLGVCALTYLGHPHFAAQAGHVQEALGRIADPHTQSQMRVPVALSQLLPPGIKGVLCLILLMGVFGGDATHLHSWGGIFVQDVLAPLRRKPFGPKQHLVALRLSIIGVAVTAFLFGSLYRQVDFIYMWWSVTTAIFVSGAGATIIGGLYWKKGTTSGAWASLLTGSTLAVSGIVAQHVVGNRFPLNGMQISFGSMLLSSMVYVVVSLLTWRSDFNMDRMLHRGAYATTAEAGEEEAPKKVSWVGRMIGIDEDFTRGDRWIAGMLGGWSSMWVVIFVVGTIWNLVAPWPLAVWSTFWHVAAIGLPIFLAVVTGIWFTWGGIRDMRDLMRRLREGRVNHLDDGTVVGHQNLDESAPGVEKEKMDAGVSQGDPRGPCAN